MLQTDQAPQTVESTKTVDSTKKQQLDQNINSEDVAQMVKIANQVDNVLTTLKTKFETLSGEIMTRSNNN